MKFELDAVVIEDEYRRSALARRIVAALPAGVPVEYVDDARALSLPSRAGADSFRAGKRTLALMRRRAPFMMACPAGSAEFACCGYLVLTIASQCPMDCSYCFLQEYLADNPGFKIYANYADAFAELDALARRAPGRALRVGTGELADSLAFDSVTGLSRDLVAFFAARDNLTLELKTKTDEIANLLALDPRGRVMVSWTLSTPRMHAASEHRTAPPSARIAAARRVLDAGYRVAFHFDPIIAYEGAERDYLSLIDELLTVVPAHRIAFVSMGGLRMTPALRAAARRRFPDDPMLVGEDVLAADGRFRTFAPLRLKLYRALAERIRKSGADVPIYLCMETPGVHERVLGAPAAPPAIIGARLAQS
jgi:DNA repair photolyase